MKCVESGLILGSKIPDKKDLSAQMLFFSRPIMGWGTHI
jgi:hypothetical protein